MPRADIAETGGVRFGVCARGVAPKCVYLMINNGFLKAIGRSGTQQPAIGWPSTGHAEAAGKGRVGEEELLFSLCCFLFLFLFPLGYEII